MATATATAGPKPAPLPDPPAGDFMSEAQWETLYALLDGVIPSIRPASAVGDEDKDKDGSIVLGEEGFERLVDECAAGVSLPDGGPSREMIREYLGFRPSVDDRFREDCLRTLAGIPQRDRLAGVLGLLCNPAGSMLLTGYWTPVASQPTRVRHAIVQSWASSHLTALRSLAKSLNQIAQKANAMCSRYFDKISGYSDVPADWKQTEGYAYEFVQVPAGAGVHEMATDVVIVGSGCGGGVCAKNIAEAGHRVLVVDKGYHFPPSALPMTQDAACQYLFDAGGVLMSDSASTGVVCGACWGGGGTVNWSVCLRLQDIVRDEWASRGLPLFASGEFDDCMDRVWDFVGASKDAIRQNGRNAALLDGVEKLGWRGGVAEQNTAGREHYCGRCHLGCGSAEKRGPATSWLPAAGEAGAEFMEGFAVERVVFADDGVTAIGVEGLWTGRDDDGGVHTAGRRQRRVFVRAKKVIVSGGSIWSPVILAKSGVDNRNVGRHLHLHPTNLVSAVFGNRDMCSWEGGIITSYVDEFENLDGLGHGVKLEPTCNVPYTTFSVQTWLGGIDTKVLALKYRHLGTFIALTRDRDSGRVYPDPEKGTPRIEYDVSDFDREHTIEGVIALAKICYVAGATEIRPHLGGLAPFVAGDGGGKQAAHEAGRDPEFTDGDFAAWIRRVRRAGNGTATATWASAHQMGSCRMSADEEGGVVDERGRVWGRRNLYVADASVFPSASGVNPMVTAMALADWISRGVVGELARGHVEQ